MLTRNGHSLTILLVMSGILLIPQGVLGQIGPCYEMQGMTTIVTWGGDKTDPNPINDTIPPAGAQQGNLKFFWTNGETDANGKLKPHPDYGQVDASNATDRRLPYVFYAPNDKTITDWRQIITDGAGNVTDVHGAHIRKGSPWAFYPLSELPLTSYRIPDLAPTQGSLSIFTAVNLDLYLRINPNGFGNGAWQTGQTLSDIGIIIVNGQVPDLQGIFWATTEFIFDPDSPDGFVPSGGPDTMLDSSAFQQQFGDIVILAAHEANPNP